MVTDDTCRCPGHSLSDSRSSEINKALKNGTTVVLILLDKTNEERYEGHVAHRLTKVGDRWNIRGKGIHRVPFKNEEFDKKGIIFRPV
jgi:hypothetical protein